MIRRDFIIIFDQAKRRYVIGAVIKYDANLFTIVEARFSGKRQDVSDRHLVRLKGYYLNEAPPLDKEFRTVDEALEFAASLSYRTPPTEAMIEECRDILIKSRRD